MVATGGLEIILLLALSGGTQATDLVSLIPPNEYFKSRKIEVSTAKMLELAGRDPVDGKSQVAQLLALRFLGENPVRTKKAKEFPEILQALKQIALGKKARDRLGFSEEYASWALARFGEAPAVKEAKPARAIELLSWFPADATLAGAVDARHGRAKFTHPDRTLPNLIEKTMRPAEKEELFSIADRLGNVRIYGSSFSFAEEPGNRHTFIRITGKADHQRLAAALFAANGSTEIKGLKGERITLSKKGPGPAMALIGDTDLILAGLDNRSNDTSSLTPVLDVRAGKKAGLLAGPLQKNLAKIDGGALGLLVGGVPEKIRAGFSRDKIFAAVPQSIHLQLLPATGGLDLRFEGEFSNAGEAKDFGTALAKLRSEGLKALKLAPKLPFPELSVEPFAKTLESLHVEGKGSTVVGRMQIQRAAVAMLPSWFFLRASSDPEPESAPAKEKGS